MRFSSLNIYLRWNLTLIKCLFTHFVNVFFCTRSRSSAKQGQRRWDINEKKQTNNDNINNLKHVQSTTDRYCTRVCFFIIIILHTHTQAVKKRWNHQDSSPTWIVIANRYITGWKNGSRLARLHLSQMVSEHSHCRQMRFYCLRKVPATESCLCDIPAGCSLGQNHWKINDSAQRHSA